MSDRTTIPNAAFAVSHVWAGGKYRPDTITWVKRALPRLANALDMLHVCGATYASVRTVVESWTATISPFDSSDRAKWEDEERLCEEWPELVDALNDLAYTSRAGRPTE